MSPEGPQPAADPLASVFAGHVVEWQRSHGRSSLPWQNTRDPYRVWLSEVMLQQTQVAIVLGYFERFTARFPTVCALAAAAEDDVLALWSGLGYYSRARNLHRCAQEVVARFGGAFPQRAAALATLPGIGRSTAAAIAAFCFGERVAILDGNVKRVLTRVLGFAGDLSMAANEKALWERAGELMPAADRPDDIRRYTQGLMDLGATVCLPRRPSCLVCPVADLCAGRLEGAPERYPVKTRKLRRGSQALWMLHASDAQGRVWLERRPGSGIWAGLHALPVFETRAALLEILAAPACGAPRDEAPFVHALTHKDLYLHPVRIECGGSPALAAHGRWVAPHEWRSLGLPAPVRRLLEHGAGPPGPASSS